MREVLERAIQLAREVSNPAPQNETETCHRIIYPLLLAADYGFLDIKAQDVDAARSRPDYTLLADSPEHTWFLEAKAWNVTLEDNHAVQAINYANTQGKRWAVLSNGREWRLYDNHISGTADVKLATNCLLVDDGFVSFLEALSKPSILGGKLEGFVRNQRLYTTLASQLQRADSDLIKAIVKALRAQPGLSSVSASDVVGYFTGGPASAPVSSVRAGEQLPITGVAEVLGADTASASLDSVTFALGADQTPALTFKKPVRLDLPNGDSVALKYWYEIPFEVALYLARADRLPRIPLYMSKSSKSPLLGRSGSEVAAKMREPVSLPSPYDDVLVEGHFSATDHVRSARRILTDSGMPLSGFLLTVTA